MILLQYQSLVLLESLLLVVDGYVTALVVGLNLAHVVDPFVQNSAHEKGVAIFGNSSRQSVQRDCAMLGLGPAYVGPAQNLELDEFVVDATPGDGASWSADASWCQGALVMASTYAGAFFVDHCGVPGDAIGVVVVLPEVAGVDELLSHRE